MDRWPTRGALVLRVGFFFLDQPFVSRNGCLILLGIVAWRGVCTMCGMQIERTDATTLEIRIGAVLGIRNPRIQHIS
jgi:hypothetical protein